MLSRRWLALLALVLVAAGCAPPWASGRGANRFAPAPTVGAPAPDFTLTGLDGKSYSLSHYRGHVVLINFWATWCIPCRAEIPELETSYKKYQAQGVVFLGLDWKEGSDLVQPFVDERQVTYPILLDASGTAYDTYQVPALPETFVVDRQGRIAVARAGLTTRDRFAEELKTAGA